MQYQKLQVSKLRLIDTGPQSFMLLVYCPVICSSKSAQTSAVLGLSSRNCMETTQLVLSQLKKQLS